MDSDRLKPRIYRRDRNLLSLITTTNTKEIPMKTPSELRAEAAFLLSQATELETTQLTRADLAGLDPEAIVKAKS